MNKKYIWALIVIAAVVVLVVLYRPFLIYMDVPTDKLGVFGDSFGALTALFSGLAFVGLIITIIMQGDELKLQREELRLTRKTLDAQRGEMQKQNKTLIKQRFENTFFKMLGLLDACIEDAKQRHVRLHLISGEVVTGRDAVRALYKMFYDYYLQERKEGSDTPELKEECKNKEGISKEYQKFYEENEGNLGQYYRVLYNIFKLVKRTKFTKKEKLVYTNLVRARLSKYELLLIFYNCLSPLGEKKMAPLIRDYKILKHLDKSELPKEVKEILKEFLESKN